MMSVTVVPVSMVDFKTIAILEGYSIGIFEAAWMSKRRVAVHRNSIFEALTFFGGKLPVLYSITVNGSDDAEDLVVDGLRSSNLPAVAIFSHGGKIEHSCSLDSTGFFNSDLFYVNLNRVRDNVQSILNSRGATTESMSSFSSNSISEDFPFNSPSRVFQPVLLETVTSLIFDPMTAESSRTKDAPENMCGIEYFSGTRDRMASQSLTAKGNKLGNVALRLFISGDKSSVGKSSTCLAILASLIRLGVDKNLIAYIKPVTQCEAGQPVTDYCARVGIAHCGVGPVVFYKGFTRAFLKGETPSSDALIKLAVDAVNKISIGKRIVIVDGVGYPSVGSICNLSNAHIAAALGCAVLLVGKSGVGDAVDSFNINARFFESYGVTILGGIFNKIPLEGFYSLEACKEAVTSYFKQYGQQYCPYGFIPLLPLRDAQLTQSTQMSDSSNAPNAHVEVPDVEVLVPGPRTRNSPTEDALVDAFLDHVDFGQLLYDIFKHSLTSKGEGVTVPIADGFSSFADSSRHPVQRNPSYGTTRNENTHGYDNDIDIRRFQSNSALNNDTQLDATSVLQASSRVQSDRNRSVSPDKSHSPLKRQRLEVGTKGALVSAVQDPAGPLGGSGPVPTHRTREEIEASAFSQGAVKGG